MTIPPAWIVSGLVVVAAAAYAIHCESAKAALAETAALGRAQDEANAKKSLRDMKAKERSDENHQRNLSRLAADVKRLRDDRPSLLPTASTAPAGAVRACYDRAEFDSALREYRDEVARGRAETRELIGEGAKAIEGLDTAKVWAAGRE